MSGNNHDPRSSAMIRKTHPGRFARRSEVETREVTREVQPPQIADEETPDERETRLKKQVEELSAALESERREKMAFRQAAIMSESNELQLHRRLSPYVEGEMASLRTQLAERDALRELGEESGRD